MDPREQLLQNLMEQLNSFELPARFDQAQKDQIMKGRKGQAEIDEGRRAISENERLYQDAVTQRKQLSDQIQSVQNELTTSQETEQANSPYEQSRQALLFGAPLAAGVPFGIWKGMSSTASARDVLAERAKNLAGLAQDVRSGEVPRTDASRAAKSMGLLKTKPGGGPLLAGTALMATGALHRAGAPYLAESEMGQDINRAFGGFEAGIGTGLLGQQLVGGRNIPPYASASDVATVTGSGAPQSTPPQAATPQSRPAVTPTSQTPVPTNAQTLIAGARAAGLEGKITKASAAKYLLNKKTITDQNRGSIAKALRVSPGPNFTERLSKKIKGLSSSRKTLPGLAWPFIAGAMAYDTVTSNAEASSGGITNADRLKGAATGTAAGGAVYAGGRMLDALGRIAPHLGGVMSPVATMGYDPLEGGSREATEQNISEARGQASSFAPGMAENIMGIPRSEGEMYSKAQVPTPNPARGLPPGADPDVAKAWRKSPRRTIIELSKSSGLDAQDIATLAGVAPDEVNEIMGAIPQQAMEMRASP
jgi:hypothetical protein